MGSSLKWTRVCMSLCVCARVWVSMYARKYAFTYLFLACEASFSPFHHNASPPLSSHDLSGVDIMPTCRDKHVKKAGNSFRIYVATLIEHVHFFRIYPTNIVSCYLKDIEYGWLFQHCFNTKKQQRTKMFIKKGVSSWIMVDANDGILWSFFLKNKRWTDIESWKSFRCWKNYNI